MIACVWCMERGEGGEREKERERERRKRDNSILFTVYALDIDVNYLTLFKLPPH